MLPDARQRGDGSRQARPLPPTASLLSVGFATLSFTLVFWLLDGCYLKQERLFRYLYDGAPDEP